METARSPAWPRSSFARCTLLTLPVRRFLCVICCTSTSYSGCPPARSTPRLQLCTDCNPPLRAHTGNSARLAAVARPCTDLRSIDALRGVTRSAPQPDEKWSGTESPRSTNCLASMIATHSRGLSLSRRLRHGHVTTTGGGRNTPHAATQHSTARGR
jgi:hypothetical protein